MIYFASLYSDCPALVSVNPRKLRSKSLRSRSLSNRLICFMTSVGVMYNISAAFEKLPASAAAMNVSS